MGDEEIDQADLDLGPGAEVVAHTNLGGIEMIGTVEPADPPEPSEERTDGFLTELSRHLGMRGFDMPARQQWLAEPSDVLGGLTPAQVIGADGFVRESPEGRILLRLAKNEV